MKRTFATLGLVLALASSASAQDWVKIFNGKDLEGWEGTKHWSVKDGAITGTITKETLLKTNTFLVWKAGKLENFELKLKFRMDASNSGVQFRSKQLEKGDYVVAGYQADIDMGGFIGILYEERGRGILVQRGQKVVIDEKGKKEVVGSLGDAKELIKGYDPKTWNEYHIVAKGNHIQQFLNGKQTVDLVDNDQAKRAMSGILALQIHVGPPMEVQFKDLELKRLP